MYTKCTCPQHLGEWGIDDQSLVLLNNVVLPLNEQTEGCLTQELQTTQVCNLTREAKRPPKEGKCSGAGGMGAGAGKALPGKDPFWFTTSVYSLLLYPVNFEVT